MTPVDDGLRDAPDAPTDAPPECVILDRYLAGESPAQEAAEVSRWLLAHPGFRNALETTRRAIDPARAIPSDDATDAAWSAVAGRINGSEGTRESAQAGLLPRYGAAVPRTWPPHGVGAGVWWSRWTNPAVGARAVRLRSLVAAMIVIAVGVGLAASSAWRRRASIASPSRTYATAAGQRLSVTLVDGTRLTLAPASRVRVAADYGRGTASRELELEGEAYFAVVHDAAHPFAVRAHGAVARDVGTAFDVRAYPEDAGARIAVAEGVVAVSQETRQGSCLLSPHSALLSREACGAQVRVGDVATAGQGRVAVEHRGDVAALTAWTKGRLIFEGTPLRQALVEVGRWYNLDVHLPREELPPVHVTAAFADESVDQVLDALESALPVRLQRQGQTVVVRPAGDPTGTPTRGPQ